MSAQELLESVRHRNRQLDSMLRAQAHLRRRHKSLLNKRPLLARQALEQSQALAEDILRLYRGLPALRQAVGAVINRLPHPGERELLKLVYLTGLTVEDAAPILHYSPRHAYRVRLKALGRLEALVKKEGDPLPPNIED